ncbi:MULTISPECIES: glycerate kinase [unclassified Staphylococcus]|uniref:glycerate kinase n=1 Tax=unclassified Staphylococcus TaxID=91994 RepID=UPI0021CF3D1D|nr:MULTISPECIES: glycerate kinase [unclassified Staphylococcus]UXR72026.1 glycerate kinase [Staphylococcus sp. IVB6240]UXR74334.1 glycerate kinase [Staphylococcus sp. IVB6238]UXR76720.1 glycerate kinase [Staphylococcus sp. IVB6233]
MKVLVAMDAYQGILSSYDANRFVEEAVASQIENADIVQVPLFNGRHELLEATLLWHSGTQYQIDIHDAQMRPITASYGQIESGLTVIEASQFLTADVKPIQQTSFGLGEVLNHALDQGMKHVAISVGGTQVLDGGAGMLQALGVRFYNDEGDQVDMRQGASQIKYIRRIDVSELRDDIYDARIQILSDFESHLYGKKSEISQRFEEVGMTHDEAVEIDNLLWYYSELFKNNLRIVLGPVERGGAGGGIAAVSKALLGAEIVTSHVLVDQIMGLDQLIQQADLIIFGEGVNEQDQLIETSSLRIAELAQQYDKTSIAICGTSDKFARFESLGVTGMFNTFIEMPKTFPDFKLGIQLRNYVIQAIKLLKR